MGVEIIKCSRGEDLYMEWDHGGEEPTAAGTHAEMIDYLPETTHGCPSCRCTPGAERLGRADTTGTSSLERRWGTGWDATGLIYHQRGFLPRARFAAFARHWIALGDAAAGLLDMLEPLDGGPPA